MASVEFIVTILYFIYIFRAPVPNVNTLHLGPLPERWSRCYSKGSASPSATIRQLEGTDAIFDRESLKSGFYVPLEAHNHLESVRAVLRGKMESVPLQRLNVAQCDHTTAGGHRRHSGTGVFLKVSVAIHWRRKTIWNAVECGKEKVWNRCHSKGSASPSATVPQLKDARCHF